MVVTRKSSNSPLPPTSRTSSTQAVPRVDRIKSPQKSAKDPQMDDFLLDGKNIPEVAELTKDEFLEPPPSPLDITPPRRSSAKKKLPKEKGIGKNTASTPSPKRTGRLTDWLARLFLLYFVVYVITICPSDTLHERTVCRGLHEYRRLIVEPYIVPPIQRGLTHPSVAPYLESAITYYNSASRRISPLIRQTQREWKRRIVPRWKRHVTPLLKTVDARLQPYLQRISDTYERYAGPYMRKVDTVQQLAHRLQPKLLYASAKLYDGYVVVKPYLLKVGKQLQHLRPIISQYIITPLGNLRRVYVDPHVAQIWERVLELSSGKARLFPAPTETVPSVFSSTFILDPDVNPSTATFSSPPVPVPTDDEAKSVISIVSSTVGSQITNAPDITTSSLETLSSHFSETIIDTPISMLSEATETMTDAVSSIVDHIPSVAAQHMEEMSTLVSGPTEIVGEAVSVISNAGEYLTEKISSSRPTSSADIELADQETMIPATTVPADVPSPIAEDDSTEIDLDEFYAGLGLEVDEDIALSVSEALTPTPDVPVEETEEEKAERARIKALQTAEKRKHLEVRHTHWEAQLEQMIKTQRKALRSALVALRKAAAAELKNSTETREALETLHREAEKALKGTEAYSTKLRQEQKSDSEKFKLWERLVNKVDEKFQERLRQVEFFVNQWYGTVLQEEYQEVEKAANNVKNVAEEAQADIGLDYAWLDDVTFLDWRRYHGLFDKYKEFRDYAFTIQNGTHPSPPINPVMSALDDLQSELQDIVVGFETRLRRIKREVERAFVRDETVEELEMKLEESDEASQPEVSILPIADSDIEPPVDIEAEIPYILVGRDREEVLSALGRAGQLQNDEKDDTVSDQIENDQQTLAVEQTEENDAEHTVVSHTEL